MKKAKKLLVLIPVFAIVFTIYLLTNEKKIYYVALGGSLAAGQTPYREFGLGYTDFVSNYLRTNNFLGHYIKDFTEPGHRITGLISDIETNIQIEFNGKSLGIKRALRDANLVTLSIGQAEMFYKISNNNSPFNQIELERYVNEVLMDLERLIIKIKTYFKGDLILVGFYNPLSAHSSDLARELAPAFLQLQTGAKKLAQTHGFHYVDTYEVFLSHPEFLPNPKDMHPTEQGYSTIASLIIDVIEKNIIR